MSWLVRFLPEAEKDLHSLSHTQQTMVKKAIEKVKENPLPQREGGFGKPLGNKRGVNLSNMLKIKLRGAGIRVVYRLEKSESRMIIVVVGIREDEEVYDIAYARRRKYNL